MCTVTLLMQLMTCIYKSDIKINTSFSVTVLRTVKAWTPDIRLSAYISQLPDHESHLTLNNPQYIEAAMCSYWRSGDMSDLPGTKNKTRLGPFVSM